MRLKILFLLQESTASMSVHCCHMHVTNPHCSTIGNGGMALKRSKVLGWCTLKWSRSAVRLQNGLDGFKVGQTALKQAHGFKTVQVSNRSVTYINISIYVYEYVCLHKSKFYISLSGFI